MKRSTKKQPVAQRPKFIAIKFEDGGFSNVINVSNALKLDILRYDNVYDNIKVKAKFKIQGNWEWFSGKTIVYAGTYI